MDVVASIHIGCEMKTEEQEELRKGGGAMWHMGHASGERPQGGWKVTKRAWDGEKQERVERSKHNFLLKLHYKNLIVFLHV